MSEIESASGPPPMPVSVALLDRRSVVGAVVVLGVALFYIVALPFVQHAVVGDDFAAGEPYVVGGTVAITPAEGWALDESSSELFTVLTSSGASLLVTGAVEADSSAEEMAKSVIEGFEADDTQNWVVGDPQTFRTGAGDHGVSVTAHASDAGTAQWVIVTDSQSVTLAGTAPDSAWHAMVPELERMVESVTFVEEGQQ